MKKESQQYCRIYWDYYGPSALGTARHFAVHLREWLKRQEFEPVLKALAVEEKSKHHAFVSCDLPMDIGELTYRSLKAHRAEVISS